jgi:PhnB protein
MTVRAIPEGYHSITPYLHVRGAPEALQFYATAFGAEELMRMSMPDGTVGHAEMKIGDAVFMLAEESDEWNNLSPTTLGGTTMGMMLYVEDVDAVFRAAVEAGATVLQDVSDQFYGDRSGTIVDPFGHRWTIATHIEDVSQEEMERRLSAQDPSAA